MTNTIGLDPNPFLRDTPPPYVPDESAAATEPCEWEVCATEWRRLFHEAEDRAVRAEADTVAAVADAERWRDRALAAEAAAEELVERTG